MAQDRKVNDHSAFWDYVASRKKSKPNETKERPTDKKNIAKNPIIKQKEVNDKDSGKDSRSSQTLRR